MGKHKASPLITIIEKENLINLEIAYSELDYVSAIQPFFKKNNFNVFDANLALASNNVENFILGLKSQKQYSNKQIYEVETVNFENIEKGFKFLINIYFFDTKKVKKSLSKVMSSETFKSSFDKELNWHLEARLDSEKLMKKHLLIADNKNFQKLEKIPKTNFLINFDLFEVVEWLYKLLITKSLTEILQEKEEHNFFLKKYTKYFKTFEKKEHQFIAQEYEIIFKQSQDEKTFVKNCFLYKITRIYNVYLMKNKIFDKNMNSIKFINSISEQHINIKTSLSRNNKCPWIILRTEDSILNHLMQMILIIITLSLDQENHFLKLFI